MPIRLYNTLSRKIEAFEPLDPPNVGIYLCGPTVYKPSHIGHTVGPIIFDAIVRYLKHRGFAVRWVVNITDVDDKLIAEANAQGRDMLAIAREVEADYRQSLERLGVVNITDWPRATDYIAAIVELVQRLVERGAAYVVEGDVWFDHTAKDDYGKLSGRKVDEALSGTRQLEGEQKRHPADFALWKAAKPGEPAWDSPWGPGRPGWHIECSAMSMKLLGETFDIHGGGLDLIFPHHENEIAQSECAHGSPYVKYWMHNGLTRIKTKAAGGDFEKMSKSLGNIRTIKALLEQFSGETIRTFVLSTHYRRPLDFSDEQLEATAKALDNFYRMFERIERLTGVDVYGGGPRLDELSTDGDGSALRSTLLSLQDRFYAAMDEDFNTAGAIASLHEMVAALNRWLHEPMADAGFDDDARRDLLAAAGTKIVELGRLLGLFEHKPRVEPAGLADSQIDQLLIDRQNARKAKDFARADAIRDQLAEAGIEIMDSPQGTTWRRK